MAKVTDIQDKNGTSKEIQDKDLSRQTAATAIASTDYVMLQDTSGGYHKIAKASFTEAVRSALGSVINSTAKGTGISKVPVLDSNNDLGMGTLANLASVLGAKYVSNITTVSNDCNDIRSNGYYAVTAHSQISNLPEAVNGMLHVIRWDNVQQENYGNVYQYYYSDISHIVWYRATQYGNINTSLFGSWAKMSPGAFLNDYSSLSSLASALGALSFKGRFTGDADTKYADNDRGIYNIYGDVSNLPSSYGTLIVLVGSYTFQIVLSVSGNDTRAYIRSKNDDNTWRAWKTFSFS